jgi:HAD superfamily hydrolase (TIGR01549 family)
MRAQVDLGVELLERADRAPRAPPVPDGGLRPAFEAVYADAVAASQQGRSVSPAAQIAEAGRRTGRRPEPRAYLDGLAALVARTPFRTAPGAEEVIRGLRADGWRTAVVSNTVGEPGESLRPVLGRLGVDRWIDAFVFSDEHPWTKPSPELFLRAVEAVGARADRTVHVGDGWVDIEGARRAKLRAGVLYTGLQRYGARYRELFLPPDWTDPSTPYRFARWPELPELLGTIP